MRSHRNATLFSCLMALFFCIVFLFPTIAVNSIPAPIIGNDDSYDKDVGLEESVFFNWTVYRNSSVSYAVTVTTEGFEAWNQEIYPSLFVLDNKTPYQIVTLRITIPKYPEVSTRDATVFFRFRLLNGTENITVTRSATAHITGVGPFVQPNYILGLFQNPLPSPFDSPFFTFIINILLWICIAFLVYLFIKQILIRIAQRTETLLDDALIEIIRRPILFLIMLYGIIFSIYELNISVGIRTSLSQLYMFVVYIIGIYMAYRIFEEVIEEITRKKGGKNSSFGRVLRPVLRKIGLTVIIIGGLIFALDAIGIQVTALLAGAGIVALVIAFAAQDTLSNFFSGIHLLLDRPFRIGDVIYLETGEYCRVDNVGMRSTRLYSIFDHELIVLPNNSVANQKIINVVKPDVKIRKTISVGVAYGSDLEKVTKILYDAAYKHPNVVKEKGLEPHIRFEHFGDSSLDFKLIVWIDQVMHQWDVLSDIRKEIDTRFKEEQITIPFPQRTIWLNQVNEISADNNNSSFEKKAD